MSKIKTNWCQDILIGFHTYRDREPLTSHSISYKCATISSTHTHTQHMHAVLLMDVKLASQSICSV